jgi:hypothetical protein
MPARGMRDITEDVETEDFKTETVDKPNALSLEMFGWKWKQLRLRIPSS